MVVKSCTLHVSYQRKNVGHKNPVASFQPHLSTADQVCEEKQLTAGRKRRRDSSKSHSQCRLEIKSLWSKGGKTASDLSTYWVMICILQVSCGTLTLFLQLLLLQDNDKNKEAEWSRVCLPGEKFLLERVKNQNMSWHHCWRWPRPPRLSSGCPENPPPRAKQCAGFWPLSTIIIPSPSHTSFWWDSPQNTTRDDSAAHGLDPALIY